MKLTPADRTRLATRAGTLLPLLVIATLGSLAVNIIGRHYDVTIYGTPTEVLVTDVTTFLLMILTCGAFYCYARMDPVRRPASYSTGPGFVVSLALFAGVVLWSYYYHIYTPRHSPYPIKVVVTERSHFPQVTVEAVGGVRGTRKIEVSAEIYHRLRIGSTINLRVSAGGSTVWFDPDSITTPETPAAPEKEVRKPAR